MANPPTRYNNLKIHALDIMALKYIKAKIDGNKKKGNKSITKIKSITKKQIYYQNAS